MTSTQGLKVLLPGCKTEKPLVTRRADHSGYETPWE